jgi:hypothetical protein
MRPATRSIRYTRPTPLAQALRTAGPGRAELVERVYEVVERAGGVVWDCEPKFGWIDFGVELPGGDTHPCWPELHALQAALDVACEVCGAEGELRTDLAWWRCLCTEHHEALRGQESRWGELHDRYWRVRFPLRPELWSHHAAPDPGSVRSVHDSESEADSRARPPSRRSVHGRAEDSGAQESR